MRSLELDQLERENFWRANVDACQQHGGLQRDYCQRHGLVNQLVLHAGDEVAEPARATHGTIGPEACASPHASTSSPRSERGRLRRPAALAGQDHAARHRLSAPLGRALRLRADGRVSGRLLRPVSLASDTRGGEIFAVGDDDQAAYSFRGANIAHIRRSAGVPCVIVGDVGFYQRAEIKDALVDGISVALTTASSRRSPIRRAQRKTKPVSVADEHAIVPPELVCKRHPLAPTW